MRSNSAARALGLMIGLLMWSRVLWGRNNELEHPSRLQTAEPAHSFLLLEGRLQPMLEGRAGATKDMSAGKKRRT